MTSLYIDRKATSIRIINRAICLQKPEQQPQRIPLELIKRVVITCHMDLSSHLLSQLTHAGISILIVLPQRQHGCVFILGDQHNAMHIRFQQYACMQSEVFCLQFSQRIVHAKLLGQQQLLQRASLRYSQQRACQKAIQHIKRQRKNIAQSQNLQQLMGLEGTAAHAYFQAYSQLFSPALNMSGRNRRPPKDPVNACLSLAYTLLHFEAVQVLHTVGLDVMGGLFHSMQFGRESLACDVIEPLRPKVDYFVLHLFRNDTLRLEHFSISDKNCMLQKTGRQHFYAAYEDWVQAIRRLMRRQARSFIDYLKQAKLQGDQT